MMMMMKNNVFYSILLLIYQFQVILTLTDIKNCRNALGMQSGHMLDAQITASSSYDMQTLGPIAARIRTEKNGGAWCPKSYVDENSYEYLQINLKSLHVLTMIETQGRFGNGDGVELTQHYRIEYTRDTNNNNNIRWTRYRDRDGNQEFKGNDDTYTAELREFNRPIIARQIRIVPLSKSKKTVCLRVELYGCQFKDDILSYETRNGDSRGTINFTDKIYDGVETQNGYLRNGLGLLTDGDLGDDSFRNERYGIKGYDWLGWRNTSFEGRGSPVLPSVANANTETTHKILFKFDNIRNFSLCTLYINNVPNQRIELYKMIRFRFSLNGVDFVGDDIESTLNRDLNMHMARPILVPLKFNVGRYVLIEIQFHSKWFILSEITFDSDYVDASQFNLALSDDRLAASLYEQLNVTQQVVTTKSTSSFMGNPITAQALIMILITMLALLLVIFVLIICCFVKKREKLNKKFQHQFHQQAKQSSGWRKIRQFFCKTSKNRRSATNTLTTALTSTTSSTSSSGAVVTTLQQAGNNMNTLTTALLAQHHPHLNNLDTLKSTNFLTSFENSIENGYLYPSLRYKALGTTTNENADVIKAVIQQQKYLKMIESHHNANNIHYAATDLSSSTTTTSTSTNSASNKMIKLVPIQQYGTSTTPNQASQNLYYTIKPQATTMSRMQVHHLNNQQQQHQQFVSMRKIDANLLSFLDKVGESTVSNFYIGKMNTKSLMDESTESSNNNNCEDENMDVLIKVLKTEHDPIIKFGFDNDIDLTIVNKLKIDNLNLIQLMGFCDNPYCYIIESYSQNLYEYMMTPTLSETFLNDKKTLVNISLQITNAMLYLESINSIHKDLSCKNCIISVGHNNEISIKICDLARYMYNYRQDYCILLTNTQQSIRLRYTSWETICTGQFTSKSDVWSFGAIIFELLTLGKNVLYADLNDEQLIQVINTTYMQQQQQQASATDLNYLIHSYLAKQCLIDELRTNNTNNYMELVDLMFECFNLNIFSRPTFNDLNLYLKYQYDLLSSTSGSSS